MFIICFFQALWDLSKSNLKLLFVGIVMASLFFLTGFLILKTMKVTIASELELWSVASLLGLAVWAICYTLINAGLKLFRKLRAETLCRYSKIRYNRSFNNASHNSSVRWNRTNPENQRMLFVNFTDGSYAVVTFKDGMIHTEGDRKYGMCHVLRWCYLGDVLSLIKG